MREKTSEIMLMPHTGRGCSECKTPMIEIIRYIEPTEEQIDNLIMDLVKLKNFNAGMNAMHEDLGID